LNTNLKTTGERLVPHDLKTVEEYIQLLRHLFAYQEVKSHLGTNDRVLEIGFGEGYGTKMLSESCREIIAIDVEKDAVSYAQNKYGDDKCRFQWYEGSRIPFDNAEFDAAVSFQVIEHIQDDKLFVAEISRVLKSGGRCYMTTPNRETRLKPNQKPWNRFHIREYADKQLAELLRVSFVRVDVFGVKANEDIMKREARRISPGFILGLALKLGMRKWLPASLDPHIARFIGKLKGQQKITDGKQDFRNQYSLDDFWLEKDNVRSSLDLFALCVKDTITR